MEEIKPLPEKLKEWLLKEGYPFEMCVARKFREQNFVVSESSYYQDNESGKFREIDILAYFFELIGKDIVFQVNFIVECKYSKNPWLVFSNNFDDLKIKDKYKGNIAADKYLEYISKHYTNDFEKDLLCFGNEFGHSIVESFKDKQNESPDLAYKAVDCVFKVLENNLEETNKVYNRLEINIPIVALRGKLYKSNLNSKNEIELDEIKHVNLIWKKRVSDLGFVLINVVTEDSLNAFLSKLKTDILYIYEKHRPYLIQYIQATYNNRIF